MLYAQILENGCIPLTAIPSAQQESFVRYYLLRNRYVDIDLIQCITPDANWPCLSAGVQQQITEALIADPKHILLFDGCENLHRGNVSKIDVLRQIYDESNIPMVLCGTYQLQALLSGANDHNQPQIFRRLFKAEFKPITKEKYTKYIELLENTLPFVRP